MKKSWSSLLSEEFEKPYFLKLSSFIEHAYDTKVVYPKKQDIYKCFDLVEYEDVKVVILGQDPYHQPNQAHGLAFSVLKGNTLPKSLVNIYKELEDDLNIKVSTNGNLESWALQGVLLLNTVLTVEESCANAHKSMGWEIFTDRVLMLLNDRKTPVVFVLWGKSAISKSSLITNTHHLILKSAHPSPLSAYRGFFKSKPFSKINDFLISHQIKPIDWKVKDV